MEKIIDSADILVISGTGRDVTGCENMCSDAAIINAAEMDAVSVVNEVWERLKQRPKLKVLTSPL
ncbi:MAG: YkuS family protein [Limnochordia bacterium]